MTNGVPEIGGRVYVCCRLAPTGDHLDQNLPSQRGSWASLGVQDLPHQVFCLPLDHEGRRRWLYLSRGRVIVLLQYGNMEHWMHLQHIG